MASVSLQNISKRYGNNEPVLHNIRPRDRAWRTGGAGRPQRLRQVHLAAHALRAGRHQQRRAAHRRRTLVNDLPPAERGIAMVFQSYALYPHMTVYRNMAFGLQDRTAPTRPTSTSACAMPPRCCTSTTCWSASPASSRAGSASAWPSAAPSCASRVCSCSTSRCPTWTPRCACQDPHRAGPPAPATWAPPWST